MLAEELQKAQATATSAEERAVQAEERAAEAAMQLQRLQSDLEASTAKIGLLEREREHREKNVALLRDELATRRMHEASTHDANTKLQIKLAAVERQLDSEKRDKTRLEHELAKSKEDVRMLQEAAAK